MSVTHVLHIASYILTAVEICVIDALVERNNQNGATKLT